MHATLIESEQADVGGKVMYLYDVACATLIGSERAERGRRRWTAARFKIGKPLVLDGCKLGSVGEPYPIGKVHVEDGWPAFLVLDEVEDWRSEYALDVDERMDGLTKPFCFESELVRLSRAKKDDGP
jgi:hypothetical protein